MRLLKFHTLKSASAVAMAVAVALTASPAQSQEIEDIVVTARKTAENLQRIPVAVTAISAEQLKSANIVSALDLKSVTPGLQATRSTADNSAVVFKVRGITAGSSFGEASVATYVDGVYRQLQFGLVAAFHDMERVEVLNGPQGTLYGKNASAGLVSIITRKPDLEAVDGYVTFTGGTYAAAGSDNRNAIDVRGAVNIPIAPGKVALRVAADRDYSGGYGRDDGGVGHKKNNGDNWSVRGHLLFAPNDDWKILLSGDYASFRSNGQTLRMVEARSGPLAIATGIEGGYIQLADYLQFVQTGIPGPSFLPGLGQALALMGRDSAPGANFYDEHGTGSFTRLKDKGASLTIDGVLNDSISMKSITAYRRLKRQSKEDVDGTPLHQFESSTRNDLKFWSQELNFYGTSGPVDWQLGGYYNHYSDNVGGVPGYYNRILVALLGTVTAYDAHLSNDAVGVFAHGNFHITDALTLAAGLRWSKDWRATTPRDANRNPVTFAIVSCANVAYGGTLANNCVGPTRHHKDDAISYDIALSYQVNPDLMTYAKVARGYKAGNINTNGNYNDFEPEYVQNYEVGVKSEWLNRTVLFNAAGYYTKYSDIQRSVTVTLPNGTTGVATNNAAKAHIWGAEVQAIVRPAKGLELAANYAYTAPKYDNYMNAGVDLSGTAFEISKHTINTHVQYSVDLKNEDRLTARFDYVWQSPIVFASVTDVPWNEPILRNGSYGLVNGRIAYDNAAWDATVALFARNLTNKKYYISAIGARPLGVSLMSVGEPRFIGIEITKRFGAGHR